MPKQPKKPTPSKTIRLPLSFPDPRLLDVAKVAVAAETPKGENPNLSRWVRDAMREKAKRQGFQIPA